MSDEDVKFYPALKIMFDTKRFHAKIVTSPSDDFTTLP